VFELALEQVQLAESLGLHDAWVTEHHFIPFGINSNALTLAAFLLGRTSRLRVGTAVTLAPQYHPLQLAEQVAILDQVSGGRLDFGIGRGGYLREFEAFGIDTARWSEEIEASADVLLDAWTKAEVSSERKWFPFSSVPLTPRPRTKPHPPLFLATSTPSGVACAARHRLPLLHYWGTPLAARLKVQDAYRSVSSAVAPAEHVHALIVIVSDDEGETRKRLRQHLGASFRDGDWPHVPQAKNRHLDASGKPVERDAMADFVAQFAIIGSRGKVAADLESFARDTGADRISLYMEAIVDRDAILGSIERFAREVAPHFTKGGERAQKRGGRTTHQST
jgi:alkanesulfonate monooxygenase SsuD/methylene tetrahydromethanopterin reductase-like flavin-dependent oxidoreductase (luciferase family)